MPGAESLTFFWYFQCDYALCVSALSETQNRLQQAHASLPLSFLCFSGKLVIEVRVKSNYPALAHARMSRAVQCRGLIKSKKTKQQPAVVLCWCSSVLQAAARLLGRVISFPRDLLSADHVHLTSRPHPLCLSRCVWIMGYANYTLIFHVSGGGRREGEVARYAVTASTTRPSFMCRLTAECQFAHQSRWCERLYRGTAVIPLV